MTKLHEEPNLNLEAMTAKVARISNVPTNEDIQQQQEAQMAEVQRALLSYNVAPAGEEAPIAALPFLSQPPVKNILPPRAGRIPRFGDKRNA